MYDSYGAKVTTCMKIHEKARHLRGRFLNSVAVIERELALILTDYFCTSDEEKRKLFFINVVNAHFFSLNVKRDVLIRIVKQDYPRYWDQNGQFLKDLKEIMEFRNKLAHSIVDVSEKALSRSIEHGIGFVEWKEGEPVTDEEFEGWEVRANMILSTLSDIKRLLPYKEHPLPAIAVKKR